MSSFFIEKCETRNRRSTFFCFLYFPWDYRASKKSKLRPSTDLHGVSRLKKTPISTPASRVSSTLSVTPAPHRPRLACCFQLCVPRLGTSVNVHLNNNCGIQYVLTSHSWLLLLRSCEAIFICSGVLVAFWVSDSSYLIYRYFTTFGGECDNLLVEGHRGGEGDRN